MFAQRMSTHPGEKRRWANLRHVNGVAVYQEHAEQSGEGGAFMVSAVVRATPKSCFQVTHKLSHTLFAVVYMCIVSSHHAV
jgi:type IV pilus biogenesis protein CpaD/CtpE